MFEFREYQKDIINKAVDVCKKYRFVYLAMEVRTGKTLTSLGIASALGCKNVLFLTKKKAITAVASLNRLSPSVNTFNECGSFTVNFSIVMNDCSDYAYFPSSFTPNQDGINDAWLPVVNNIQSYHIEIFDRWGNLIFFADDINKY